MSQSNIKLVADNIKKLRELKSITRDKIASDLGMSVSNYSKIERGEIDLTISRVQEIADVIGVDFSQILSFDASQIFNISNNNLVQGVGAKAASISFHGDEYKDKYIKLLEEEVTRLKNELKG
jgi:transcriptional regulator with XRE-family HTH domain